MYSNPNANASASSTGSAKRLSTNNPFRSALMQQEALSTSDPEYKQWMQKQTVNEEESDNDSNSFSEGDELDFSSHAQQQPQAPQHHQQQQQQQQQQQALRPRLSSRNSDSTVLRRRTTNPFTEMASRKSSVASGGRNRAASRGNIASNGAASPAAAYHNETLPPSYEEAVGDRPRYAKDEYPDDHKSSASESDDDVEGYGNDSNPFPTASVPRRSQTTRAPSSHGAHAPPSSQQRQQAQRTGASRNSNGQRLSPRDMTATTETEIMSDGRVRSKSVSDHRRVSSNQQRSGDRERERDRDREHRSSSRRHHHHHHHRTGEDGKPRRHKSTRGHGVVLEKPKNLDTIDKLDVTGFFGGGGFHHDGPFDACTPHRNKDTKQAPVMAFPPDGPNSTIKGMGPIHTKEEQYDMVFGLSEEDPLYTTRVSKQRTSSAPLVRPSSSGSAGSAGSPKQSAQGQAPGAQLSSSGSVSHRQASAPRLQTSAATKTVASGRGHGSAAQPVSPTEGENFHAGAYGNGVVVQKASRLTQIFNDEMHNNPSATRFGVATKATPVHGDTTLGLGSSTFMEGAPASTATQHKAKERGELTRKKSIMESNGFLRRVKSLKVRRSSAT